MLGGCQSFPLTSWFKDAGPARHQPFLGPSESVATLEEGKAFLRQGRISAAIASFRIARSEPSTRAEASNGLGVAFAKLGRLDLADRYFQAALSAEPDNQRYVANLLRLEGQIALAGRESRAVAQVAAQSARRAPAPRQRTSGPVKRVSPTEVLVQSLPELAPAPIMAVTPADEPLAPAQPVLASVEVNPAPEGPPPEGLAPEGLAPDGSLTIAFSQ